MTVNYSSVIFNNFLFGFIEESATIVSKYIIHPNPNLWHESLSASLTMSVSTSQAHVPDLTEAHQHLVESNLLLG